ncbi:hypothetical protein [Halopseudomonas sp.]|uniref:hypothetical protein n=1 Tax=Halopseudomonas sp. TaxID=2901191 RepID=UPI001A43DF71|nr:hypothetical protein [Pseudomonas sp.]|tara:strand:+ start:9968 stop:10177 length:210 start_codon:yes stop_codon:yes gene_type:complete
MAENPIKDKHYDLISSLYHACQGLEVARQYARDAEAEGDNEAASYFKEVERSYADLSAKGKKMLRERLN